MTPLIVLNSWRDQGSFLPIRLGENHWESRLTDFVHSLGEDEIEKLREKKIPGLMEIIDTVKRAQSNYMWWKVSFSKSEAYAQFIASFISEMETSYGKTLSEKRAHEVFEEEDFF